MKKSAFLSLAILILSLLSPVFASTQKSLGLASHAPIQIESDSGTVEQMNQQATYLGNVILTQATHELRADKLTIKKDPKGHLSVIVATGKPASFKGSLNNDPEPVYATAKTIYYYPDKQLIVFEGSATLAHHADKFKGPVLSYQIDTQVISATSQSKERPMITIQPRQQAS